MHTVSNLFNKHFTAVAYKLVQKLPNVSPDAKKIFNSLLQYESSLHVFPTSPQEMISL